MVEQSLAFPKTKIYYESNYCDKGVHLNEKVAPYYLTIINDFVTTFWNSYLSVSGEHRVFLLLRGIDVINNVFRMLLIETRNLDLSVFHTQKSFYFYIEFIEQIFQQQKTVLNLTSRDAMLFVYKRTIYDLNQDIREKKSLSYDEKKMFIDLLELNHNTHTLIGKLIENYTVKKSDGQSVELITGFMKKCIHSLERNSSDCGVLSKLLHIFTTLISNTSVSSVEDRTNYLSDIFSAIFLQKIQRRSCLQDFLDKSQMKKVKQMISYLKLDDVDNALDVTDDMM